MKQTNFKFLLLLILLIGCSYIYTFAQPTPIRQWDKTLGGDNFGEITSMIVTSDGGYMMGGYLAYQPTNNGGVISPVNHDYWIIKTDVQGNKLWVKALGGSSVDQLICMLAASDGGILLGGLSYSNKSGDKGEDNKSSYADYWIIKIDVNGNKIWDKTLGGYGDDFLQTIVATSDDGFLLGGMSRSVQGGDKSTNSYSDDYWIIKIDKDGNKLWDKTLGGGSSDALSTILDTSDGGFLLGGTSISNQGGDKTEDNKGYEDFWLVRTDAQGNKLWDKTLGGNKFDGLTSMIPTSDGGFLLGGSSSSSKGGDKSDDSSTSVDYWVVKIDALGNKLWDKTLGGNDSDALRTILSIPDDGFLLGGSSSSNISRDKSENNKGIWDYWVIKIDALGNKIWDKTLGGNNIDSFCSMLITPNKDGFILGGWSRSSKSGDKSENSINFNDCWLIKLKEIINPNHLSGTVFQTTNCNQATNKAPLSGWAIKAESNPNTYYSLSDSLGRYTLYLDKGTYIISQIPPMANGLTFKNQTCPTQPYQITFEGLGKDATGFNFGLDVNQCAVLKVDVSSSRRRRCFQGQTTITYQNEGIAKAENVQLEVDFPEFVIPLKSSVPWTTKKDKTLIFNLGTLQAGEQKRIVISDSVACVEQVRNLTQCVEAHISPKNSCVAPNPNWNGANLELRGKCFLLTEPIAQIILKNTGKANMAQASKYRIFANDSLLLASTIQLIAGDSLLLEFPTQGLSIRVEAEQVPLHPEANSLLSVSVEGCNLVNNKNPQNQGFVNRFMQADANLETEIDCQIVRDSFDPNDKLVSPEGITEKHYVKPDTRLEYTLRFQNTGTAEAINIQVVDTLSQNLNFETFEMMSASHPYRLEVRGSQKQVLIFKFPNINLPDSTSNEPQSHGFIKFKISPKANLAVGTIVKNFADIYFDYNEPVRTNVTEINYTDYQFPIVKTLNPCKDIKDYAPKKPIISQINNENRLKADINEVSYQWYRNGTLIAQNTQTIEISQSGEYEVVVSKNACNSEKSAKLSIDICKTDAFFLKKPTISQIANENKLSVDISDMIYQWYRNGTLIAQNTQVIEINQSGDYEVIVSKNGCSSEKSAKLSIDICKTDVFFVKRPIILQTPNENKLKADISGATYQWFRNGTLISQNTQTIDLNQSGEYEVIVNKNGCISEKSAKFSFVITALSEFEQQAQISLYPNPSQGDLNLKMANTLTKELKVSVLHSSGKIVWQKSFQTDAQIDWETSLDLNHLPQGLYFLEIENSKGKSVKKIIVER